MRWNLYLTGNGADPFEGSWEELLRVTVVLCSRESYYDDLYYYAGGGGGWSWGFWGLVMLAAWRLPPMFGFQPFFGMSIVHFIWLLQMLQVRQLAAQRPLPCGSPQAFHARSGLTAGLLPALTELHGCPVALTGFVWGELKLPIPSHARAEPGWRQERRFLQPGSHPAKAVVEDRVPILSCSAATDFCQVFRFALSRCTGLHRTSAKPGDLATAACCGTGFALSGVFR